ncbi:16635_t:CDS:2, partial [Acaulospora morrowiae]
TCSAVRTSRLYLPSDCTSRLCKVSTCLVDIDTTEKSSMELDNEEKFQKVCIAVGTAEMSISIQTNRRT